MSKRRGRRLLASDLRDRVELLRPVESRNASTSEPEIKYVSEGFRWMEVRDLRGEELVEARQVNERVVSKVRALREPDVTPRYRLRMDTRSGARTLEVEGVIAVGQMRTEMLLTCSEAV